MTTPTMLDFYTACRAWQERQFGTREQRGPEGALKHLVKECDEALRELKAGDLEAAKGEIVDCLFMAIEAGWRDGRDDIAEHQPEVRATEPNQSYAIWMLGSVKSSARATLSHLGDGGYVASLFLARRVVRAAGYLGMTHADLLARCWAKLAANQARQWPKPVAGEPVEHVREVPT